MSVCNEDGDQVLVVLARLMTNETDFNFLSILEKLRNVEEESQ